MKQRYVALDHRIERHNTRAFEAITTLARKRQIIGVMRAAQRLWMNMFNRKRIGTMIEGRLAILATIQRTRENQANGFSRDTESRHKSGNNYRASLRTPDHLFP